MNEIHDEITLMKKNNILPNIIDSIKKTDETLQTLYSDKITGAQIRYDLNG